jgi:hypothetical protein
VKGSNASEIINSIGSRLVTKWKKGSTCRPTTESKGQPVDSREGQEIEKQVGGAFVISRM